MQQLLEGGGMMVGLLECDAVLLCISALRLASSHLI